MTAIGVVLLLAGVALGVVGALGWRGRLPHNRVAGVRTPATLRSPEAFAVGNRVAGPPIVVAGAVWVVAGVLGLAGSAVLLAVAGIGGLALLISGGLLGDRAARQVRPPAAPTGGGCVGCACASGPAGCTTGADAVRF